MKNENDMVRGVETQNAGGPLLAKNEKDIIRGLKTKSVSGSFAFIKAKRARNLVHRLITTYQNERSYTST